MQTIDNSSNICHLDLDILVTADATNDPSVYDNDSNQGDFGMEDNTSDAHEDDGYEVPYLHDTGSQETNS